VGKFSAIADDRDWSTVVHGRLSTIKPESDRLIESVRLLSQLWRPQHNRAPSAGIYRGQQVIHEPASDATSPVPRIYITGLDFIGRTRIAVFIATGIRGELTHHNVPINSHQLNSVWSKIFNLSSSLLRASVITIQIIVGNNATKSCLPRGSVQRGNRRGIVRNRDTNQRHPSIAIPPYNRKIPIPQLITYLP